MNMAFGKSWTNALICDIVGFFSLPRKRLYPDQNGLFIHQKRRY